MTAEAGAFPSAPGAAAVPPEERALYLAFREHQAGKLDSAVQWYAEALKIRPAFPEALNNYGIALKDLGRLDDAIASYRKALEYQPDTAELWNNLGDALHANGDLRAAVMHYERAVSLRPDYGVAWRNLGDARSELGELDAAENCYRTAIAHAPDLDARLSPTALGLREVRTRFARAVKSLEAADAGIPGFAKAYWDLGAGIEAPVGCRKQVQQVYDYAADLRQRYAAQLSALLLAMHYEAGTPAEEMFRAHGEAERFYGRLPRRRALGIDCNPDRRLRIGYVSADLRTHSVAYFLSSAFRCRDAANIEIYCYSNASDEDEQTQRFRDAAAAWRPIVGKSDSDVAELIRNDEIDILVDLSGHTNGNRLGVFARRAAPIQVTWLGYPDTTGLTTIDYRITDALIDPPGPADELSSETLVRLPSGLHNYSPPLDAPPPSPPPCVAQGYITFGSFNNLIKVNDETLDVWSRLLQQVSGSRLVLKSKWLGLPGMRERMHRLFEARGIARDRIDLMGQQTSIGEHLDIYSRVDIGLDTFPYTGATTTCEALWMGVPVVTLAGDRHVARVGVSLLTRIGLPELVARSPDEYVAAASALAADRAKLAVLRAGLRQQFQASPLCDHDRFTRDLEAAYRRIWRHWCGASRNGQTPL